MAEHDRMTALAEVAVRQVQVGVADPGRRDADPDLSGSGIVQLEVADIERRAVDVQYRGPDVHATR
jgi:hypothetical protein